MADVVRPWSEVTDRKERQGSCRAGIGVLGSWVYRTLFFHSMTQSLLFYILCLLDLISFFLFFALTIKTQNLSLCLFAGDWCTSTNAVVSYSSHPVNYLSAKRILPLCSPVSVSLTDRGPIALLLKRFVTIAAHRAASIVCQSWAWG